MESITPNQMCTNCWQKIYEEDGFLVCDCFKVSKYELAADYQDYPDIWVHISEVSVIFEWFKIAGRVTPCPKCGQFLTSLGLCSDCGVRYELIEQQKPYDVCETCGKSADVQVLGSGDKVEHEFCDVCYEQTHPRD